MEAAMRLAPRPFFALSSLVFIAAAGFCAWKLLPVENGGVMSCSTKAIMRFENMEKENVNGNIHFNFAANGKGSMVVEGYTDSAAGWLYLQRYVKFSYTSKRISTTERHYRISKWESSASSIDESPDVIFDYFMREMSDSHDGLFLNAQKLMLAFKTVKNIHQRIARLRVRYDDGRFTQKAVICARDNLRAQQRNRLVNAALKAIQRRIQRVQRFGWNLGRVVGVSAPAAENRLLGQHGKREGSQQQGGKRQKSKKLFHDESSFQSLGLTGLYVHFYFVHPLDDRKKGKVPSF